MKEAANQDKIEPASNNNLIVVNTAKDEVDSSHTLSLREAIALANKREGLDRIEFDDSLYDSSIRLTLGELKIEDDLTVDASKAKNITVNAQGNSRVFKIDDGLDHTVDVTLNNLTVIGGVAPTNDGDGVGGGILNQEKLNLANVVVRDNIGDTGGGIANRGSILIDHSQLNNNISKLDGGAIANQGNLSVINSSIKDNTATVAGAGIFNQGTATVFNSSINNNSLPIGIGGAVMNQGSIEISNSDLSGNLAKVAGAIMNYSSAGIRHSSVNNNTGTAIVNNHIINISNSGINTNSGEFGGAIDNRGAANIAQVSIKDNSAMINGGAILNEGKINAISSEIKNNSADNHGGGIANVNGELNLIQSRVSDNTAGGNGAGIYSQQAATNLEYSGVRDNSIAIAQNTSDAAGGGGIYAQNSALNLNSGTVSGNEAMTGGGIYADSSTVTLEDSIIEDNQASLMGDDANYHETKLNLTNSTVDGNTNIGTVSMQIGQDGLISDSEGELVLLDNDQDILMSREITASDDATCRLDNCPTINDFLQTIYFAASDSDGFDNADWSEFASEFASQHGSAIAPLIAPENSDVLI